MVSRQVLVFPDECHGIGAYANQLTAAEATREFFERHLVRAASHGMPRKQRDALPAGTSAAPHSSFIAGEQY